MIAYLTHNYPLIHAFRRPARGQSLADRQIRRRIFKMAPTLHDFFHDDEIIAVRGGLDRPISGITMDSRRVVPGNLFFALPGLRADGATFIDEAINRGAVAVVTQKPVALPHGRVSFIQVADARTTLARVAQRYYRFPDRELEVVGVTATARYQMISEAPRPYLYLPLQQDYSAPFALMIRGRTDPLTLAGDLRAAVQSLDPNLPVYSVRTMDHLLDNSFFARLPMRLGAMLAAFQGAIGLLLAVLGLYSVVAYAVSRRTREIGIRMALGADARDVVRLVVREGMRLTVVGVAAGLVLAGALGVGLSKVLYGLGALDPVAFVGGTVLLLATAGLACYLPARRATRVNPVEALRAE